MLEVLRRISVNCVKILDPLGGLLEFPGIFCTNRDLFLRQSKSARGSGKDLEKLCQKILIFTAIKKCERFLEKSRGIVPGVRSSRRSTRFSWYFFAQIDINFYGNKKVRDVLRRISRNCIRELGLWIVYSRFARFFCTNRDKLMSKKTK